MGLATSIRRFRISAGIILLGVLLLAVFPAHSGNVVYETDPVTGRLTKATFEDGSYMTYAYDANGNRTGAVLTLAADLVAPTAPTSLVANAVSGTQVNLSWNAASDNVAVTTYVLERCQGAGCASFSEIAQPAGTNYPDSGRTPATSYSYRVKARDAAGNTSGPSNVASASTPDTLPPSAPGTPQITGITANGATVTYTGATDNVLVTGYEYSINNGTTWNTAAVGTFTLSGLTSWTTYTVQVRARDSANLTGNPSASAPFTTLDNLPPSVPGNVSAVPFSSTQINVSWNVSTDNRGISSYSVERCAGSNCSSFAEVGTPTTNSFPDPGRTPGTLYSYRVRALDLTGLYSGVSLTVTTNTGDTSPPTSPPNLQVGSVTGVSAIATWDPSSDNVGVTAYEYSLNGGTSWLPASSPQALGGLTNGTSYTVQVRAKDAAGLASTPSSRSFQTVDTSAPSSPPGLSIGSITATSASASWGVSTDNVGVTGYEYSFNGGAWTAGTSPVSLGSLTNGTTYSFQVRARDAAGLTSTPSSTSFQTTDTTPPGSPPSLAIGSITATSAVASWGPSSDNVAVVGYDYSFNGGAWTAGSSPISLTGLTNGTNYSFQVRARDAAGLTSTPSSTSFQTTDTTPPGAPPGLAIGSITATSASASWSAASDNVGVTGYDYSFNGGAWTPGSSPVSLTGLTNGTTYSFQARARDAAGLASSPSSTSFMTIDTSPPTTPSNVQVGGITGTSATGTWTASTDNVGVTVYEYGVNGSYSSATASTSGSVGGLTNGTGYTFNVRARDAANLTSPAGSASFTTTDTSPPGPPATPGFSNITGSSATASWGAASDNVGVTGYQWRINGGSWNASSGSPASLTGLSPNTLYTFDVQARDAVGLWSTSSSASFTTPVLIQLSPWVVWSTGANAPHTSTSYYRVLASGDVTTSGATWGQADVDIGDWIVPKSGMSNYQVRQASGNCQGPAVGQWIALSLSPAWSKTVGGNSPVSGSCSMTIEISAIANPSVILATAPITINTSF